MNSVVFAVLAVALPTLCSSFVTEEAATMGEVGGKMQCEYYSSECVDKAERQGLTTIPDSCHGVEDCAGEKNICFVVWNNKSSSTLHKDGRHNVKLMGCFEADDSCSDQQACLEDDPGPKNSHFFCCCKGHLCNAKFEWVPKPPKLAKTSTVQPPTTLGKDEPFLVTLYCIVPVVFLIFLVTVIWFVWRKRKAAAFDALPSSDRESGLAMGLSGPGGQNYGPQLPQDTPIELLGVIGSGRFGAVWKGKMSGNMVAVKIFPLKEKMSWLAEKNIYNLPQLDGHDNVLKFLGVDQRNENLETEFWLATEFHEKGSLYDFLKTNTVSWEELCKIALSIGRGLTFLHEEIPANGKADLKPAVAHRDFKSKNVLIKSDLTACIADFGLALIFEPDKSCGQQHGQVGTRRYMAPEVLEGAINFSRDAFLRIDMYACGLVLWELATRCTVGQLNTGNAPNLNNATSNTLQASGEEYKLPFEAEGAISPSLEQMQEFVVTQKLRPKIKPSWRLHPGMSLLCDTIEECWDHDAEARLSASCVVERVRDFQHRSFSNNIADRYNALNVDSGVGSTASTATDDTDNNSSSLADDLDVNISSLNAEMTPLFILNQNCGN